MDEVVWVRLLKLTLGNTVYATSVVVSVFMAGLALGALIMGRFCDRLKRHLRVYALIETLITISALSLPWVLKLTDHIYVWLYRSYNLGRWQLLVVQVIISAGVLLVPSMLMGSTLPLLGRFVTSLEKEVGHLVGRLYALNTLGAATGCLLAGFILIRAFGVMGTLYTAAALNMLVAFGGWFLSRSTPETEAPKVAHAKPKIKPKIKPTLQPAAKTTKSGFALLAIGLFASGLISIGYELLWMRSIVHLLGGFTYVFSAVLTIYLLGNVIGAGIGSRLAKKTNSATAGFAVTLCVLGFCGIIYLPALVIWMSRTAFKVEHMFAWMRHISPGLSFTAGPLIHCFCLFILPSIVMGMGFPMALQAWANYVHKVGRSTGTAYGANTIGAVVGGVVTGFIFLPLLGVQTSILILGLIGTWIGASMWFLFYSEASLKRKYTLPVIAGIFTFIALSIPAADFFGAVVRISPGIPDWDLLKVKEGITTTVSVHRDPSDGSKQLHSSGQSIAGDSYAERGDQKMLGHFGVFLNRYTNKVLSVGFGSGETTACLSQHNLEQVDCVEIAPEILEVSLEYFKHINLGDRLHDEINMIFMDAKNYIHLTDTTYDVIINDSIHPREFAENASLYSKEYFQSAAEKLNQNGMIMSWVPTYGMPSSVFVSIIGTLMDVFPHVTMWYPAIRPAPLVLVIGSMERQNYSPDYIEKEFQKPGVRQSLMEIGIRDSVDVISCYVGDQTDLKKVIGKYKTNSDYTPFVEFTTDHVTPPNEIFSQFIVTAHSDSIFGHIDWIGFDSEQKDNWLRRFDPARKVTNYLFMAMASRNGLGKLKYSVVGLTLLPKHPALMQTLNRANKQLYIESTKLTKSRRFDDAMNLAKNMLKIQPNSAWAWLIKVNVAIAKNDMSGALSASKKAVQFDPNNHETHFNLGFVQFKMKRYDQAIAAYKDMLKIAKTSKEISDIQLAQMTDALAIAYFQAGKFEEAIAAAQRALKYADSSGRGKIIKFAKERLASFKSRRLNDKMK